MSTEDFNSLFGDAQRQRAARSRLRDVLDAEPTTLAYLSWSRKLPPVGQLRRVAIVSSFTVATMKPYLEVESYLADWHIDPVFVQYAQWENALHDPMFFSPNLPEAYVLLLHDAELVDQSHGDVDAVVDRLTDGLAAFRSHASAPLFIGLIREPGGVNILGLGNGPGRGGRTEGTVEADIHHMVSELDDVYLLDLPGWLAAAGAQWFDNTGYLASLSPLAQPALPLLARGITRNLACIYRSRCKILIVDLDNTLWGGVVGEDGVSNLNIGETYPGSAFVAFQKFLLRLRATGILLAFISKNNEADVRSVFEQRSEMVVTWESFSAQRVNWENKADNLVEIAEELGLGLDGFVFADDSPLECDLIRELLPDVEVAELGADPSKFVDRVLRTGAFDTLRISTEDGIRANNYLAEKKRKSALTKLGGMEEFLSGLDLRLEIRRVGATTVERVHQLMGRTNQFNLSLERPALEEVRMLMSEEGTLYSAALTDKFGDYGIVGTLHLRESGAEMEIRNVTLSCRALGRRVEDALLAYSADRAKANNAEYLTARYIKGPRNEQVQRYLEKQMFAITATGKDDVQFALKLEDHAVEWPKHVEVSLPEEESSKCQTT